MCIQFVMHWWRNMAEKNKTVKPVEVLTDDKMRDLFGTNYSNIIYYNYDKGAWNRNEYLQSIARKTDSICCSKRVRRHP